MDIKLLLRCITVLATITPIPVFADSLNAKTGAWEITTTTLITGMPAPAGAFANMSPEQRAKIEKGLQARAGKPNTQTGKSCITKEDLDKDHVIKSDNEERCSRKVLSREKNKVELETACPAPDASTTIVKIEAVTPESVVATMDMVRGDANGKIHADIKGRWLGASCAGIEDD
jgi:hypothetical protein